MRKRRGNQSKRIYPLKKPVTKEVLRTQTGNIPLNKAQTDRISFSVLRNEKNNLRKIENISYEININEKWEWVVRYDDHGGIGFLHRHIRISLTDDSNVESADRIKKYKNKNYELTWVIKEIKRDYLVFRSKFLKNSGLDLY